jgi:hypothetical protein
MTISATPRTLGFPLIPSSHPIHSALLFQPSPLLRRPHRTSTIQTKPGGPDE